jgi:hypothetical protein
VITSRVADSLSRTLTAGLIHLALRLLYAERQHGHRMFARVPSPMRFHVPRQAAELDDLAVERLVQVSSWTKPSTSLVSSSRSSIRTVLLSSKAAGSDAISPETFACPSGKAATT